MEFTTNHCYDMKTLTAMARALRKTSKEKEEPPRPIFGWSWSFWEPSFSFLPAGSSFSINGRTLLTLSAVLAILLTFFFEDRLNGYFARKRLLPVQNQPSPSLRRTPTIRKPEAGRQTGPMTGLRHC